jgi:hypothetical protein
MIFGAVSVFSAALLFKLPLFQYKARTAIIIQKDCLVNGVQLDVVNRFLGSQTEARIHVFLTTTRHPPSCVFQSVSIFLPHSRGIGFRNSISGRQKGKGYSELRENHFRHIIMGAITFKSKQSWLVSTK